MRCRMSQPTDDDFRRLRGAGVPIAFGQSFERKGGVRVTQTGGPYESLVFDAGLQTGFAISLRVAIDSSSPLGISKVLLQGPWEDYVPIHWLERSGSVYVFPGNGSSYPAGDVLNHKLSRAVIRMGSPWQ